VTLERTLCKTLKIFQREIVICGRKDLHHVTGSVVWRLGGSRHVERLLLQSHDALEGKDGLQNTGG
jgi:hypothetical protein